MLLRGLLGQPSDAYVARRWGGKRENLRGSMASPEDILSHVEDGRLQFSMVLPSLLPPDTGTRRMAALKDRNTDRFLHLKN